MTGGRQGRWSIYFLRIMELSAVIAGMIAPSLASTALQAAAEQPHLAGNPRYHGGCLVPLPLTAQIQRPSTFQTRYGDSGRDQTWVGTNGTTVVAAAPVPALGPLATLVLVALMTVPAWLGLSRQATRRP
jgi:hypothetical protein